MILTLTESLLQRSRVTDGRIVRDRVLCGFCVRLNKRSRTFLIATSVQGRQLRMMLGQWPMMTVEEARAKAIEVLKECRAGRPPVRPQHRKNLPTLLELLPEYCAAKKLKARSLESYRSMIRNHFAPWSHQPVSTMTGMAFSEHCHQFAQNTGAAQVEMGRGLIGALIRYLNAVYELGLENPFHRLAAAGLMPERAKPRARLLQEADLPQWRQAVDRLGEAQRDYLLLVLYTGLRRGEAMGLTRGAVDFDKGEIFIPDTKNGKSHTLPITPMMDEILQRRCSGLTEGEYLFAGVSKDHITEIAGRRGAPKFMLHDLRKMLATVGERLQVGDAVLRRILNHTAPKSDVTHRVYVSLGVTDIAEPLRRVQLVLLEMMMDETTSLPPV